MSSIVARARHGPSCAIVGIAVAACAAPASADIYEMTWTAEVVNLEGPAPSGWEQLMLGDTVTVSYLFDTAGPDYAPQTDVGSYDFLELTLSSGPSSLTIPGIIEPGGDFVNVYRNGSWFSLNEIVVGFGAETPGVGGLLKLVGPMGIQGDDHPLSIDIPSGDWFIRDLQFGIGDMGVYAALQSFSATLVPTPGAFVVVLTVFALPTTTRRRRRII